MGEKKRRRIPLIGTSDPDCPYCRSCIKGCWKIDNWPEQSWKQLTTSKSSLSGLKSLSFSSCIEDGLSEEEGEKKDMSDVSSTRVIFYREFTDSSKISLNDRRAPSQRPSKRRSFCSRLEIQKRTKILKDVEGSEESSDNFSKLQAKVRLRKFETVTYRRRSPGRSSPKHKGRSDARARIPRPSERPEPEEGPTKYSESIFRVFLQPEGLRVLQRKRLVEEPKSPPRTPTFGRIRRGSDDEFSKLRMEDHSTPAEQRKVLTTLERLKKVASKRSVHWEDEVTFIERSSSSMSSSGETWENECIRTYRKHSPKIFDKKMDRNKSNVMNDENKSNRYKERVREKMLRKLFKVEDNGKKNNCINNNTDDSSYNTVDSNASQDSSEKTESPNVSCHRSKSMGQALQRPKTSVSQMRNYYPDIIPSYRNSMDPVSRDQLKKKITKIMKKPLSLGSKEDKEPKSNPIRCKEITAAHLLRRRSSPAVINRGKVNRDIMRDDSSSALGLNCKREPSDKTLVQEKSNESKLKPIETGSCLKFQCGENQFNQESDCHYEEVSAEAVAERDTDATSIAVIDELSMLTYGVCDKSNVKKVNPKTRNKDPKNITTETLRECILALHRIKNLSPQSPKSRLEHLGLVEGIQCSLLDMQEMLLNRKLCTLNKLMRNFDIPSVKKYDTLERKQISKYSTKLKNDALEPATDKTPIVAQIKIIPSGEVHLKSKSPSLEKEILPRSDKLLKTWEKTQKAISARSEKLLNNLRRKRENTDSSVGESDVSTQAINNNSATSAESEVHELTQDTKLVYDMQEEIPNINEVNKKENSSLAQDSKTDNGEEVTYMELVDDVNFHSVSESITEELPFQKQHEPLSMLEEDMVGGNVTEQTNINIKGVLFREEPDQDKSEVTSQPEDMANHPKEGANQAEEATNHPKEVINLPKDLESGYKFILVGESDIPIVIRNKEPETMKNVDKLNETEGMPSVNNSKEPAGTPRVVKSKGTILPSLAAKSEDTPKEAHTVKSKELIMLPRGEKIKESSRMLRAKKSKETIRELRAGQTKDYGTSQHGVKSKELTGRPRAKNWESVGARHSEQSCSSMTFSDNSEGQPLSGPSSMESVETMAARSLTRPPSRKPFFDREEPGGEGTQDDTDSLQEPARSESWSSTHFSRSSEEALKKQPPPPRMYSTLKENRLPSFNRRQEVNEKLESAFRSLNNKRTAVTKAVKAFTIRKPLPCESNSDSVNKVSENLLFSSKGAETPNLNKMKSPEVAKIREEKLITKARESSPTVLQCTPERCQLYGPNAPRTFTRKVNKSESVESEKNQRKILALNIAVKSPNKYSKSPEIMKEAESIWGFQSTQDQRALLQERLRNYVPPWERLNLKPNCEMRERCERKPSTDGNTAEKFLKRTGRSLSNPQSRAKNNLDLKIQGKLCGGSSPCSPVRSPLTYRQVRKRKSGQQLNS